MRAARRGTAAVVLVLMAALAALTLTGCTVTITAKEHSWPGWYYLCDGSQPLPCRSGYAWRVTQQEYDAAHVGQSYSFG